MAAFSKRSLKNLSTCHIDLQTLFNEVIQYVDCTVTCGHRDEMEQNLAFERGFSKLEYPKSKHNSLPAMAVDVIPYPVDWGNKKRFIDFGNFVLEKAYSLYKDGLITHRVEWGGLWSSFPDLPHYQLR